MPADRMFIVAGPPGGGKSSLFSLSDFADHVFNADDRAAELVAVGTPVAHRPPHRSVRAELPHTAPTSDA